MIKEQQEFLEEALQVLKQNEKIVGVAAAGSYITNEMDAYSDIDLVIAVEPNAFNDVMHSRYELASSLGELLSAFTGEHVGEPRLLICLYNNPLVHVDLKFVSLNDVAQRVEDFKVLWERNQRITIKMQEASAHFPCPDLQWIEDRFWIWVHYGAGKIGRGEIFETIEFISFLRQNVIGPLILLNKGKQPKGVRKIEMDAPEYVERLKQTIAKYDRVSCYHALKNMIDLYKALLEENNESITYRKETEIAAVAYLESIYGELNV